MQTAPITTAASGSSVLVAAQAGKVIRVLGLVLVAAAPVTVELFSATTALSGVMSLIAGTPLALPTGNALDTTPYLRTAPGEALNITLGGSVQVSGWVIYDSVGG